MDKTKIIQIIENFAPLELQEKWDCSGWIIETEKTNIERVLLCLTVTDKIIEQARKNNCNMIISHHPLFYVPMGYKNIDIYCAHTNMDKAKGGTTDTLIKTLFPDSKIIFAEDNEFVRYVNVEISLEDLTNKLRQISDNVRITNNNNEQRVKKIAFCAGSGSEFTETARKNGADVFITGDVKFHSAIESKIILFDIGHFESEQPILKIFEKLLKKEVTVKIAEEKSPFQTV